MTEDELIKMTQYELTKCSESQLCALARVFKQLLHEIEDELRRRGVEKYQYLTSQWRT